MSYKQKASSKGVCYNCNKIVNITFREANYRYKYIIIPNILQGFCTICDEPVSLPHESTYKINKYLEKYRHDKTTTI